MSKEAICITDTKTILSEDYVISIPSESHYVLLLLKDASGKGTSVNIFSDINHDIAEEIVKDLAKTFK